MSNKDEFLNTKTVHIFGTWRNKHGEEFVLYHLDGNNDRVFVTGDEFDWEFGWHWDGSPLVTQTMFITDDENEALMGIARELGK